MWHSHSDSASCSCFELEIFVPLISTGESRRAPRQAGSLPRGANAAGTRYGSDIVVERVYERWTDRIVSKRMFERVE